MAAKTKRRDHPYAVIYKDPSPLAQGLDGADTASELRNRWEAELNGWRGTYRKSLFRWCCRDTYKLGDEWNDEGLGSLYSFDYWGRDEGNLRERFPNFAVLGDLDEEFSELVMILDANWEPRFSDDDFDDEQQTSLIGSDSSESEGGVAIFLKAEEEIEPKYYHQFVEWLRTGLGGFTCGFGKAEGELRKKILDEMPLFTKGVLSHKSANDWPAGFLADLLSELDLLRDNTMNQLYDMGRARRIAHYCSERAVDRNYFDAVLLETPNRSFCIVVREAYLAGLRLMIQTLLLHPFTIDKESDLREFMKLATSVRQVAVEAYAGDENCSLLKFDDADVVRWAYPLLSSIRMHSYRAWWNAGARLEQGGRTSRDTVTELDDIARRLVSLLQRSLVTRAATSTFDKRVTFANSQDALEIASLDWHAAAGAGESATDDSLDCSKLMVAANRKSSARTGKHAPARWELAKERMLELLKCGELPRTVRAAGRLLKEEFTDSSLLLSFTWIME